MWMTPSVVSIFARWLPSRMSSAISGWRPRAAPDAGPGPGRRREVHPDGRVRLARAATAARPARRRRRSRGRALADRHDPDGPASGRVGAPWRMSEPPDGRSSGQRARSGSALAIGSGCVRRADRGRRRRRRGHAARPRGRRGRATAGPRPVTMRGDEEQADHDRARPRATAHASSAWTTNGSRRGRSRSSRG